MTNAAKHQPVLPGGTLGVLGSGQLGRMFAIAAKRMGYRVHVFSDTADSPAGQVADREIQASFDDLDAVAEFARQVDVVTLEFENVPLAAIEMASRFAPVHPGAQVLETTQHRLREKTFLRDHGLPVAPFHAVTSLDGLKRACAETMPCVLKTATMGYDGKGQVVIRNEDEVEAAWKKLDSDQLILEQLIDLDCEFSVVAARTTAGAFAVYAPIRNEHRNHILDVSVSPANFDEELVQEATRITHEIMDQLDAVGVLCVEFFLARDGSLMVNEIAPRPHNSGHLTIDAHVTCQFEQQVRAVCGLQLGSTRQIQPAAMVNLLGDCWSEGEPNWQFALSLPNIKLHLYGKQHPAPGRKMGHLTSLADSPEQAVEHALAARKLLTFDPGLERHPSGDAESVESPKTPPTADVGNQAPSR